MTQAQFLTHIVRKSGEKSYPPPFFHSDRARFSITLIHIYAKSPDPIKGNQIVGEIYDVGDYSEDERELMADNFIMLLEQQWHYTQSKEKAT